MKGKEIRMKSKEYEQRLEALEREIAVLRQETVEDGSEIPPHHRPELIPGKIYYYLDSGGNVMSALPEKMISDSCRLDFGNVFLTKDAAKYAAEYYKVLAQMREWAGNWNDPYELGYDGCEVEAVRDCMKCVTYGELRFASENDAENCIKAVGEDRLIKYYFGVRDHEIPAEAE